MKSLHKVIAAALFMGAAGMVVPAIAATADQPTATDAKPDAKNAAATDKADKGKANKDAKTAKADKGDKKDAKAADADKGDKKDTKAADADKGGKAKPKKVVAKRKEKPADVHDAVVKDEPKKDNKAGGNESEVQRTADLNRQSLDSAVHPASAPGR